MADATTDHGRTSTGEKPIGELDPGAQMPVGAFRYGICYSAHGSQSTIYCKRLACSCGKFFDLAMANLERWVEAN